MTSFSYRAVDAAGKQVRGYIDAESPEIAADDLTSRGYYLLSLSSSSGIWAGIRKKLFRQRVKRLEVIELAGNLSVMVGAGIPITMALGDLVDANPNATLQETLAAIKQKIEQGSTFSDAIEAYRDIFPDIFIRLVRVGEETGRFEKSLSDVAEHLQRMEDLAGLCHLCHRRCPDLLDGLCAAQDHRHHYRHGGQAAPLNPNSDGRQ